MRIITITGLFLLSLSGFASKHVTGTFFATQACPAYLSKNKKTNPDQFMLSVKGEYSMVEINRDTDPDWFRIKIRDKAHPLRWISRSCGHANYYPWEKKRSCNNTPGLADSYVLALSWLSGFCETYGYEVGKPECLALHEDFYAISHMSLHGLWPNQNSCGSHYGFCGVEPKPQHCDYPSVELGEDASRQLQDVMPAYAYGSCLERHEWFKHGSCQLRDSEEYFLLATKFVNELNEMPLGQYMHEHAGKKVLFSSLVDKVKESFGEASIDKIYFGCQHGILVDIWLQLPVDISQALSLKVLVSQGSDYKQHSNCPKQVEISDFKGDS